MKWTFERHAQWGGRFEIVSTYPGGPRRTLNFFRGAPTQVISYSSADPFGDSTCVLGFPQVTIYDDLTDNDVGTWLADFTNIDLYFVPGLANKPVWWDEVAADTWYFWDMHPWTDPLNGDTIYAPAWNYSVAGWPGVSPVISRTTRRGFKVWEGYIASMEFNSDSNGSQLQVQCQGALFQADRYLEKPFFPARPQTLESLIAGVFDHRLRPNLRTKPLRIDWPAGWTKVGPSYPKNGANIFTPNIAPGKKWTGYSSRATGSWDHSLTSFVQDQLSVMLTQDDSGVTPGNQWTLLNEYEKVGVVGSTGRQPVLLVRDRFAAPTFELWAGAPGVDLQLTRDSTQMANVIYGDGTGIDGTVWRNAVVSSDGSRTDYLPLASARDVYPPHENPHFVRQHFVSEAYVKYGTAFDQNAATASAQKTLARDLDPGWAGSVTLSVDPNASLSRWKIRAGTSVRIKGVVGSGTTGIVFHIASVEASPMNGTVSMQVDSRFRDLLNLEEAMARNRDPLTPAKLLQVNRASAAVEDVMAPWDYTAGSGFVPKPSVNFEKHKPNSVIFPYTSWTRAHPPHRYPHWYTEVEADAGSSRRRWTQMAVPVMMSEKGAINRSEFTAYDRNGNVLAIPFHVSVYTVQVKWNDMPMKNGVYSPFIFGAFERINPATGFEWDRSSFLAPQDSMIIGWGNYRDKAGYSPGRYTHGDHPTGKLADDGSWNYDCTQNQGFARYAKPGWKNQKDPSALQVYVMFYAEHNSKVYFRGRFFHQNPGV